MAGIDPVSLGTDALSTGVGIYDLIHSMSQERKSERELQNLKRPFEQIQSEYYQNRNLAAEQAQGGLPQATKDYMTKESERGLGAGISGLLQGGGDINSIDRLFGMYDNSIDKTAAEDANLHLANIDRFMKANSDLAGEKTKQWALNEFQPFEEKRKQLVGNIYADKQNETNAGKQIIGSLSAVGTSLDGNTPTDKGSGLNDIFGAVPSIPGDYTGGNQQHISDVLNSWSYAPVGNAPTLTPNL